jgi:hypothetical protein
MLLPINATDAIPRLKIEETVLKIVEKAVYLGDTFNNNGSNKDLIEDRVNKGNTCIINSISLCDEVTLGTFTVQTLLLLYQCLYIAVTLYNSQAWSKLSKNDLSSLQVNQLKFLKRIFHAPSSTPNTITFLETGTMPIKYEIDIRRLNFLHHILTLSNHDPVRMVYLEQLKYKSEPNWGNDVRDIRKEYGISKTDEEITEMTKESWKRLVKKEVKNHALKELNSELALLKMGNKLGPYAELRSQEYLDHLYPQEARCIFQIRSGVIDTKCTRKYWYEDTVCRLCNRGEEDVNHVVNLCPEISRNGTINLYTDNTVELKEIAKRFSQFENLINDGGRDV